ncbi:very short patch repair endonuclease [Alteromonas halophila]|uniref:very short patch repair endonuclease n=1 Tax=Alteromonas halophila TaxID=516698 RepID=UPI001678C026
MADVHTPETRRKNMRAIRGKNTKPEVVFRKLLFNAGYRYRIAPEHLPSKPDLYMPRFRAVILINGCFWHGHNCHLFHWPKTRTQFWKSKIKESVLRDTRNIESLTRLRLRVLVVWECALKGKHRLPSPVLLSLAERWLTEYSHNAEISSSGLSFRES